MRSKVQCNHWKSCIPDLKTQFLLQKLIFTISPKKMKQFYAAIKEGDKLVEVKEIKTTQDPDGSISLVTRNGRKLIQGIDQETFNTGVIPLRDNSHIIITRHR